MKIGILTFHRALNYGAVLQCYGLYSVLESLGHQPEIIDYRPESIERYRKFYSKLTMSQYGSVILKVKEMVASLIISRGRRRVAREFNSFLQKHFNISNSFNLPMAELNGYEAIIFGSDQIWSPSICFGFDKMYWGQFEHGNTKSLTYAASLGGHNILSASDRQCIKEYIKSYDHVSVRETQLRTLLREEVGKDYPVVVDPTLLAGVEVFDRIAKKPEEKNYVLLFTLEPNENAYNFAKSIAEKENLDIVTLKALPSYKKGNKYVQEVSAVGVEEFLGYLKYAKYVVAISFHGTVFSVLFQRDFYSLKCSQGDRAYNFLQSVGLEERMVDADETVVPSQVNYSGVSEKLEVLRNASLQYIIESLKG